ncbi:MAG: transglutaminase-like putative cysteine protease [Halioglobus sp.]
MSIGDATALVKNSIGQKVDTEKLSVSDVLLRASCELSFEVVIPTPMVFMLRPRSSPTQWVAAEEYHLSPSLRVVEFADGFGNLCQRLVAPVGDFHIRTSAEVQVSEALPVTGNPGFVEVPALPEEVLRFLLPSRYCESDRFGNMAMEIVADAPLGYAQVQALTNWVRENIRFEPLSSTYPVSATEVNGRGEGVCRDLSHVTIALCRALCIPARLVVGYLYQLEPMDSHAWFEAYVGGQWHTFDPVFNDGLGLRIAVAHGRDAADVAVYNQYGPLLLPKDMRVSVDKLIREK